MDINRFTEKAQQSLQDAQRLAARNGQQHVDVEHLLAALLDQEPGLASSILRKANINLDGLKRRVGQELERLPHVSGGGGEAIGSRLNRLLMQAEDEAKQFKDEYVSVEHLLLAVAGRQSLGGLQRFLGFFGETIDVHSNLRRGP